MTRFVDIPGVRALLKSPVIFLPLCVIHLSENPVNPGLLFPASSFFFSPAFDPVSRVVAAQFFEACFCLFLQGRDPASASVFGLSCRSPRRTRFPILRLFPCRTFAPPASPTSPPHTGRPFFLRWRLLFFTFYISNFSSRFCLLWPCPGLCPPPRTSFPSTFSLRAGLFLGLYVFPPFLFFVRL